MRSHDFGYEAKLIMDVCRDFQCEFMIHDYNGAGSAREWILMNAGVAPEKIIPVAYHTSRKNLLIEYGPVPGRDRGYISFDKTQSLMYTMQAVKAGLIRFYEYDFINEEQTGLTCDFLALIEEKVESRPGTDTYYITRIPDRPDDFAQAVSIGTNFLYAKILGQWPDLTEGFDVLMERYTSPITTPTLQNLHMPEYNY
jgi:hypothetical protein